MIDTGICNTVTVNDSRHYFSHISPAINRTPGWCS